MNARFLDANWSRSIVPGTINDVAIHSSVNGSARRVSVSIVSNVNVLFRASADAKEASTFVSQCGTMPEMN